MASQFAALHDQHGFVLGVGLEVVVSARGCRRKRLVAAVANKRWWLTRSQETESRRLVVVHVAGVPEAHRVCQDSSSPSRTPDRTSTACRASCRTVRRSAVVEEERLDCRQGVLLGRVVLPNRSCCSHCVIGSRRGASTIRYRRHSFAVPCEVLTIVHKSHPSCNGGLAVQAGPYRVTAHPVNWLPSDAPGGNDRQVNSKDPRSVRLWVRPPPTGTHQCHSMTPTGIGMMLTVRLRRRVAE